MKGKENWIFSSNEVKAKACEEILKKEEITNVEFYSIFQYGPAEYRDRIWERLLQKKLTNDELFWVLHNAPKEYKERAWEKFLRKNWELLELIQDMPKEYRERICKLLKRVHKY